MSESKPAWIALDQPELRARLQQLGIAPDLLCGHWSATDDAAEVEAVLEWQDGAIQLRPAEREVGLPIQVDFLHGKTGFRSQRFQHEMIVKAVAGRSKETLSVLDCTAGLGRDGFLLAAAGFKVTLLERNPAIACLLLDGLERAAHDADTAAVCTRIRTHVGSAHDYLRDLPESERPDVICVDPMFPEREKSALVKKEMRIFRAVVGDDDDAVELLELALHKARKRVVVKRPRKAEMIGGRKPGYQLLGKSSRFDVYVV